MAKQASQFSLTRRAFMGLSALLGIPPGGLGATTQLAGSSRGKPADSIYLADFQKCQPQAALSTSRKRGKWRLIPFEAEGVQGTMLSSTALSHPPDVRYDLKRSGWHLMYVGLYDPGLVEHDFLLRLRLSADHHFTKISVERPGEAQRLEEVFWKAADLTGQDLLIAVQSSGLGYFAQLAYVRLVPLSESGLQDYRDSLPRTGTRRLIAQHDGHGNFYGYAPRSAADLEEQLEVFRDTDFRALYWATGSHGAGLVNFPSKVSAPFGQAVNDYGRLGDKLYAESLKALMEKGIDPLQVVVDYTHSLGLEIHVTQRLTMAIWPPLDDLTVPFFLQHPEWRCRDRNGLSVIRMSLAYPEVRRWFIDQYAEVARYGIEGIGVQFNRRPPVVLFEEPVLRDFAKKYNGRDARDLSDTDPLLLQHWAEYITQFFRELKKHLTRFRRPDGGRLTLTVNVLGDEAECRAGGMDLKTWIREELVDILIPYESAREVTWSPASDLDYFASLTRGTQCQLACDIMPRSMPGSAYALHALQAYGAGANLLAFWDTNGRDSRRTEWETIRQLGHRDRLAGLVADAVQPRLIPLKSVFGYSVQRQYM